MSDYLGIVLFDSPYCGTRTEYVQHVVDDPSIQPRALGDPMSSAGVLEP